MFWSCETCNDWGVADNEVDLAVDRQRHKDTHGFPGTTEPQQESVEEDEDSVLGANYLAWGITALLGLLSAHWHALVGVVPLAGLIAFVLTFRPNDKG
jgi:hypothetical protein